MQHMVGFRARANREVSLFLVAVDARSLAARSRTELREDRRHVVIDRLGRDEVKGVHVTDLRTALNAARSTLLLPAISYSHPALTTISAADIAELRSGTQ
jgi:hypothetical protein